MYKACLLNPNILKTQKTNMLTIKNDFSFISRLPLLFFLALFFNNTIAAEPIAQKKGIAIGSHDTVAYHEAESVKNHQAKKGEKDFTVDWKGATWRFRNAKNRDLFLEDPEKFSPAYNGHCANALSLGEGLIKTNGKTWEIFEGQLYLFYAPRGRVRWNDGNWKDYKVDADRAWTEILANQ